jgi:hypothetical protein
LTEEADAVPADHARAAKPRLPPVTLLGDPNAKVTVTMAEPAVDKQALAH